MSNPTTPFGWQMPTNTDLVTDLPADFEVFGQAVATSMADLLGGTTGQILAKNSNTDMDFVWIANDQGDITGVTATSPLTGGGTSGAITVGIQASSTTQSGAVQLTDSTSSTSTTTAATPNSVKTAFDTATTANTTANAAIPKSTVTTAGDVIYATGSSAVTRLGIGSTGQVLTVAGGAPSWATPATPSAGSLIFITSASPSAASAVNINSCFTSTYQNYYIVFNLISNVGSNLSFRLRNAGADRTTSNYSYYGTSTNSSSSGGWFATNTTKWDLNDISTTRTAGALTIFNPKETSFTSIVSQTYKAQSTSRYVTLGGDYNVSSTNDGFSIFPDSGTFTGTVRVYGIANS